MNHIVESYENYQEEKRLTTNNARRIEFITTIKALNSHFKQPGKLLDCAAGTGIYSFYYADKGFDVTALDITPRHIQVIKEELRTKSYTLKADVNDATDLSRFDDETFDIVLCMGPIYHLVDKEIREKCLSECSRVLKTGGYLVTAYISRFFVFPYVSTSDTRYLRPELAELLIKTGTLHHDNPNCFWTDSYYATPDELENSYQELGIEVIDHLGVDGMTPMLKEKIEKLSEEEFNGWCDYHYSICREKSILGASNHGLIIGKK